MSQQPNLHILINDTLVKLLTVSSTRSLNCLRKTRLNSPKLPISAQSSTSNEGAVPFVVMKPMGPKAKALDVADHPDVRFWTLASWKKYVADRKGVTSNSENFTSHYLEDSKGKPLDKSQINKIHAEVYSLWFFVRDAHRLPSTWGVAAADVVDFYRTEIARRCPEMLLCEDDWKSNHLATQLFSTFKRSHGARKRCEGKEEAKDIAMEEGVESGSLKRKIENPATGNTSKKFRGASTVEKKEVAGKDEVVSNFEVIDHKIDVINTDKLGLSANGKQQPPHLNFRLLHQ